MLKKWGTYPFCITALVNHITNTFDYSSRLPLASLRTNKLLLLIASSPALELSTALIQRTHSSLSKNVKNISFRLWHKTASDSNRQVNPPISINSFSHSFEQFSTFDFSSRKTFLEGVRANNWMQSSGLLLTAITDPMFICWSLDHRFLAGIGVFFSFSSPTSMASMSKWETVDSLKDPLKPVFR